MAGIDYPVRGPLASPLPAVTPQAGSSLARASRSLRPAPLPPDLAELFPQARGAVPLGDRPVCCIAIDAEEAFDWRYPVPGVPHAVPSVAEFEVLSALFAAHGAVPTYLLTYPLLEDAALVRSLRRQMERGECVVGAQLHPWVNPPYEASGGPGDSYAGNLPPALEELKLVALRRKFTECFGVRPRLYRAGRYGFGRHTAALLEKHGFLIDTSLAPRSDFSAEGGPDFRGFDYRLFWFGERSRLLEVPLCRSIVGWGGRLAAPLYRAAAVPGGLGAPLRLALARSRCAERITLSPEGNDIAAMTRLVRRLGDGGQRIFVLSFHSSSFAVGRNPYVRTQADLRCFSDRLSGMLDTLSGRLGMRFASLEQLPGLLREPGAT